MLRSHDQLNATHCISVIVHLALLNESWLTVNCFCADLTDLKSLI